MNEESQYSIHTVCRTCLSTVDDSAAYDLFRVPGLAKKLCVCTSLSVEQADGFPKNLCNVCFSKLNDLHDFQKQCVDSVQKFQDLVASNAFACQTNFDVLDTSAAVADLPGEEEDNVHFDPLLNSKIEIIENEEDVFKMLESVEKEVEEVEMEMEQPFGRVSQDDSFESGNDNDLDADFQISSDDDIPLAQRSRRGATRGSKAKGKPKSAAKRQEEESEESEETSSSDDSDGNPKDKPKRKRIPATERDRHRLIDCHICHQKFKKAIRYEEHMKHHNDLLPFQCTVESCRKGKLRPQILEK